MHSSQRADDVMHPVSFLSRDVSMHLARRKVIDMLEARQHWMFVVSPLDIGASYLLMQMHQERCGEGIEGLMVPIVGLMPMVYAFPKAHLGLDELLDELLESSDLSPEAVERDKFLAVGVDSATLAEAVMHWMSADNLAN